MTLSDHEKRIVAEVFKPDSQLGTFARFVWMVWTIGSLYLSCYPVGNYLLLVWFYGFWRVHRESLHFTYIPDSHHFDDYIVSNGDHITWADGFMVVPIAIITWIILTALGYLVIRYISNHIKQATYRKTLARIYDA